jgi:polysaccharide pyruvyl transferase WcaK-like protein
MTRILVLGYYGFGNFGDELILSAVQDELTSIECSRSMNRVSMPAPSARDTCSSTGMTRQRCEQLSGRVTM